MAVNGAYSAGASTRASVRKSVRQPHLSWCSLSAPLTTDSLLLNVDCERLQSEVAIATALFSNSLTSEPPP